MSENQASRGAPEKSRATLTVEEAGRVLGIGRALAYRSAKSGELPTIRVGNRVLVPRAQLERLLSGH